MFAQILGLDLSEIDWWWWALTAVLVGVLAHVAIAAFLVWMPPNYLVKGGDWLSYRHSPPGWALIGLKNVLGAALVIAGIMMLVLPGPGMVACLVGVTLLDFPGKREMQCWLINRPGVLPKVNGLRRWFGKPPLVAEVGKARRAAAKRA
jgi:hypothetical protein